MGLAGTRRVTRIQPVVISNAVLERLSSSNAEIPSQGFDRHQFVDHAIDLLKSGDPQGAANIFTGITELRPTNAMVWNNLGFCQIAFDPAAALHSFGKSAMFSRDGIQIRIVNQVLALHLLGRDDDALVLASEISGLLLAVSPTWLWNHTAPRNVGAPDLVQDVQLYLENLVTHIERRLCDRSIHETEVGVEEN
jgi:hypothetical protein